MPPDDKSPDWVQAMADQADAIRAAIDALEVIMLQQLEENRFDPEVQELQAQVRELRKIYPRLE